MCSKFASSLSDLLGFLPKSASIYASVLFTCSGNLDTTGFSTTLTRIELLQQHLTDAEERITTGERDHFFRLFDSIERARKASVSANVSLRKHSAIKQKVAEQRSKFAVGASAAPVDS